MSADEGLAELVTFSCSKEAYVYAPLPPATSYGHRAELWNPDKWLQVTQACIMFVLGCECVQQRMICGVMLYTVTVQAVPARHLHAASALLLLLLLFHQWKCAHACMVSHHTTV
jgi:hypothetical protein